MRIPSRFFESDSDNNVVSFSSDLPLFFGFFFGGEVVVVGRVNTLKI